MKVSSVKKNYVYNMLLNILTLAYPLITAPYISRVLGAERLGIVNFTTSVANWFIILAAFGISSYGVREIAKARDNKKQLELVFSELILINLITVALVLIFYWLLIGTLGKYQGDKQLFSIYSVYIVLSVFSLEWFYTGIEQYAYITKRSAGIKLLSCLLLFLFVKKSGDYLKYAFILIGGLSFNSLFNLINAGKYVRLRIKGVRLTRHLGPASVFFMSALLSSLFNTFDKVILGILSDAQAVAFHTRNFQIISIGKILCTSLCSVLSPRLSNAFFTDQTYYQHMLQKSARYLVLFSLPCFIGIFVLAEPILFILGGSEFTAAAVPLKIMSFIIIFTGYSSYINTQVAIPSGNEKINTAVTFIIAAISLPVNILFCRQYSYYASACSLALGELFGCLTGYLLVRQKTAFHFFTADIGKIIISGIAMFLVSACLSSIITSYTARFFVCGLMGLLVYVLCLLVTKEETVGEILCILRNKVSK